MPYQHEPEATPMDQTITAIELAVRDLQSAKAYLRKGALGKAQERLYTALCNASAACERGGKIRG
jgi:uncharacterized protein (UPF0332 family)